MDLERQEKLFEAFAFQRQFAMWPLSALSFQIQGVDMPAATLEAFHTPPPPPDDVVKSEGVVYGTAGEGGRDLKLYLYARKDTAERRPGVIFVHGGAWVMGHPVLHLLQAQYLATKGYVTAVIFYRLAPEAPWPAALEDCKCAVRWMRANHAELGVDPDRIAVVGESAGGHLSYLTAMTPDGTFEGSGGWDGVSSAVQAAVPISGPVDFVALSRDAGLGPMVEQFMEEVTEERLRDASPATYISASCPPILSMVGGKEGWAEAISSFHDDLDSAGAVNELAVFPDQVHGFTLLPDQWQGVVDRMESFLDTHLGSP